MLVDTKTQLFCSLARPGADLGGILYNSIINALELNAVYLPTTCNELRSGFESGKSLGFSGLSVSMPYKQKIMAQLDFIDQVAKEIGAVNTLVEQDGRWGGFNTDWYGAVESLKEKTEINNKKVLLIGAGGAARAIAYGITKNSGDLYIYNRTEKKGRELSSQFGAKCLDRKDILEIQNFDILINATSIGFMGNEDGKDFIPDTVVRENMIVFDIVFSPIRTPLSQRAIDAGAIHIPGYKMLIHQALLQFKLWTGVDLSDYSSIESELVRFIAELDN